MTDSRERLSPEELVTINKQLDKQLRELQLKSNRPGSQSSKKSHPYSFRWIFVKSLLFVLALAAPFYVLIRTSVFAYSEYQLNGWIALATGVLATVGLLVIYITILAFRFRQNYRVVSTLIRGITFLVISFTLYGLLYYSSINTKEPEIREYYRSMHPILRVTLATVSLADSELLVTDIQRSQQDYVSMGLPENDNSLHYVQKNGYVHAVDLRTVGRPFWQNWITAGMLEILGLETYRHVGTADHLHVYLPLND